MNVWSVWEEYGEYDNYTHHPIATFATSDLAEAHAQACRDTDKKAVYTVQEDPVLTALPARQRLYKYASHIKTDGTESLELGHRKGYSYDVWDNHYRPLHEARITDWNTRRGNDLFVEVVGTDEDKVRARYAELLSEARSLLGVPSDP